MDFAHFVSPERFEEIRSNVKTVQSSNFRSLKEKAAFYDLVAIQYNERFNWKEERIEALSQLTYEVFKEFSIKSLAKTNKKRLALLLEGSQNKVLNYETVNKDLKDHIVQGNLFSYNR